MTSHPLQHSHMSWCNLHSAVYCGRRNLILAITQLQITVLLEICSFLDVKALCMLARTCRTLHSAASDELLWQYRLDSDCLTWSMVGHLSHPSVYRTVSSDMTSKEMYATLIDFESNFSPTPANPLSVP